MKKVVFVSVDKPSRWKIWPTGTSDEVFYSPFLSAKEVTVFIEQMKIDYPNSNLSDDMENAVQDYFIRYTILNLDERDKEGFELLCHMMWAKPYAERTKYI